jgi:hypothetical protein
MLGFMVGVDAVAGDGFVVVDVKMERCWAEEEVVMGSVDVDAPNGRCRGR